MNQHENPSIEEFTARGAKLARVFKLKRDRGNPDRFVTTYGAKTALGLARTAEGILDGPVTKGD